MASPSTRYTSRRRRSHSASGSPSPLPQLIPNEQWRCSTKRAHPPFSPSCHDTSSSDAPYKWDVDLWRRGKRARRSASPPLDNMDEDATSATPMQWSSSSDDQLIPSSAPPTPSFASTSAAFNLHPSTRHPIRHSPTRLSPPSPIPIDSNLADLNRLRSHAFGDLQRTIEESGEGFVMRMRDLENSRSRPGVSKGSRGRPAEHHALARGRKRPTSQYDFTRRTYPADGIESDDEDDIQIFLGEPSVPEAASKKRAFSLGDMDLDDLDQFSVGSQTSPSQIEGSDRCSSPIDTSGSGRSSYSSDDEEPTHHDTQLPLPMTNPFTPALTHTYTNSTNSSLISLPLPPPVHTTSHSAKFPLYPTQNRQLPSRVAPPPTSPSEKALAVLTLALANGAGGVNDYSALTAVHDSPVIEAGEVGGMFD